MRTEDGNRVAFTSDGDIWLYDLKPASMVRVTSGGGYGNPLWTADGQYVVARATRGIFWIGIAGTGGAVPLIQGSNPQLPWSLTPDGKRLAFIEIDPITGADMTKEKCRQGSQKSSEQGVRFAKSAGAGHHRDPLERLSLLRPAEGMASVSERWLRCAIYTRKSTEEGLEQSFNTLQAQREAGEASILSHKQQGWQSVPTLYDASFAMANNCGRDRSPGARLGAGSGIGALFLLT